MNCEQWCLAWSPSYATPEPGLLASCLLFSGSWWAPCLVSQLMANVLLSYPQKCAWFWVDIGNHWGSWEKWWREEGRVGFFPVRQVISALQHPLPPKQTHCLWLLPNHDWHFPATPWGFSLYSQQQLTSLSSGISKPSSPNERWKIESFIMCFPLLSESLRQLSVFKKIERRSMPWPCQLTIGSNLSIKIVAYKSVGSEYIFIFKAVLPGG